VRPPRLVVHRRNRTPRSIPLSNEQLPCRPDRPLRPRPRHLSSPVPDPTHPPAQPLCIRKEKKPPVAPTGGFFVPPGCPGGLPRGSPNVTFREFSSVLATLASRLCSMGE